MTPRVRALLIAFFGPSLQVLGVSWDLIEHGLLAHGLENVSFTHIIAGPAHLLAAVGFLVSLVGIPIALEVYRTPAKEFERADEAMPQDAPFGSRTAEAVE